MNNIKTVFSIKDLENLSGIKAHTIRIWEKRYAILSPMRTDTNIRYYDSNNLQKLLNVVLLHKHGYKISKIGSMPEERIPEMVRQIVSKKSVKHHAINAFKIAMMNFDQAAFVNTYNSLLAQKSFREVFYEVFLPLLDEIGMLWQSETITPAHEHFISYLIRQKIYTNTEKVQLRPTEKTDRVFVLFLPLHELHEMGLLYLNYEIIENGYKSVYLGESVPLDSLREIKKIFNHVTYITYFTVEPQPEEVSTYVDEFYREIMASDSELWLLGRRSKIAAGSKPRLSVFESLEAVSDRLK
ncbi:MAG: MerR family transcriptional regulator [Flavobacterium sp.]|uniref:MerR family transcriptional regulator n=1 Tax=Flavobacterium sp. TaxID=239 RepID=UPI0011FBD83B|nr:MerR family transcriptional regulator [Flavobacterium sp.]RZJ67830.1 MAG: MerR family transcriptional regulator [Flavobacterium sp.]